MPKHSDQPHRKTSQAPSVRRQAKIFYELPPWPPLVAEAAPKGFLAELNTERPGRLLLGSPPDVVGKKTRDGCAIAGYVRGIPIVVEVRASDAITLRAQLDSLAQDFGENADADLGRELRLTFFRPAVERFCHHHPRGKSATKAPLAAAIRTAAWQLHDLIRGEIGRPSDQRSNWFKSLVAAAERAGIDIETPPDPVSAAAYAIAEFSGINWKREGLRCPIEDGVVVDREYFGKQYAYGHFRFTENGMKLFLKIVERLGGPDWFMRAGEDEDRGKLSSAFRRLTSRASAVSSPERATSHLVEPGTPAPRSRRRNPN